jgi:protein PhnA
MSIENTLQQRSGNQCELCSNNSCLRVYEVPPHSSLNSDDTLWICGKCELQLNKKEELDNAHWTCLNNTMWSEIRPVQVVTWRMLNRLRNETWAAEAIDQMYLDEETLSWAKATGDHENSNEVELHRDCNGQQLFEGDTVVLIKTLDVKGSTLNAKLGTVVKNIRLVTDNTEQIEGKIEGQTIVILTKYLRKG